MVALWFWLMALVPALVPPLLLYAYARRFTQRKEAIKSLLTNSKAIPQYSLAFRASPDLHSSEWKRRLDLDLEAYAYPTVLCSLLTVAGMVAMISISSGNALRLPDAVFQFLQNTPAAAIAGFAGAYTWVLYDFIDRFRILNLPTYALHGMWFRMVLAPAVASLAAVVIDTDFEPMIGFAIGMLPVATLVSWIQETAQQRLNVGAGRNGQPSWEYVQGLTPDIVARLVEAGVTSVPHLANQDPINLLRRTNIEWRNVLDMMDQATLFIYVGPAIEKLRAIGVRGAIEGAILYERLEREPDPRGEAHATLNAFAEAVNTTPLVAQNLLHNLAEDPQVGLIWSLWFDRSAAPTPADQGINPEELRPVSESQLRELGV